MDNSYANIVAFPGGGQQATTNVTASTVTVTAATAADSVTLPQAAPGLAYDLVNIGANSVNVYGAKAVNPITGAVDTINGTAGTTPLALASHKSATFLCTAAGAWFTNPYVPS